MKITFQKEMLLLCIQRSLGCVSSEKTYGAIEGILLSSVGTDKCMICAYDLEKGVKTTIDAKVHEGGAAVINGSKLASVVKFMPADITIETGEGSFATISSGRSKFQLHYLPGEEFPQLPEFSPERSFTVTQAKIKSMINRTSFAISHEDNGRPALTGLYFEVEGNRIKTVACDSFRLAIRVNKCETNIDSKNGETELKFIVPGKTINEISRLLDDTDEKIKFSLTKKHIIFSLGMKYGDDIKETVLFSRLIDTQYIEYERFIPKESKTFVTVDKNMLEDALERASLVTEDRAVGQSKSIVKFKVEDETLHISAISINGKVFDEIPVEKKGPDMEIGFSCKYLIEILRACGTDILKLSLTSSLMSMIIEGNGESDKDDSFIYLALPMKMRDN